MKRPAYVHILKSWDKSSCIALSKVKSKQIGKISVHSIKKQAGRRRPVAV